MVEVIYDGGLGNYLFQYCFGRILAEKLGYKLSAKPIPGFPGTFDVVGGRDHSGERLLTLRGQKPDLTSLNNSDLKCHLLLTGYFQRYEYYEPHAHRIKQWLAVEDNIALNVGARDVVLSVRRGRDYIPQYGLPLSYYESALASLSHDRVFICTNELNDPFVRYLGRKYDAVVRGGSFQGGQKGSGYLEGALDNFVFIKKFKKIVISNSSFPWWAAFLSDAREIICPRPCSGMWSLSDPVSRNISLEVAEQRYQYLRCEEYKSEFPSEIVRNIYDKAILGARAGIKKVFPFAARQAVVEKGVRFGEE